MNAEYLAFPGFLWKVDGFIDVDMLRQHHGREWALLTFYSAYYQQVHDDGNEMASFISQFDPILSGDAGGGSSFDLVRDEVRRISDEIETGSTITWQPRWDRRKLKLELHRLQGDVYLSLIMMLRAKGEFGLADAVFNSIQGTSWPLDGSFKDAEDVPMSVRDWPAEWPNSVPAGKLFEYETDSKGHVLQSWLLHRIMLTGELSFGRLVKRSGDAEWELDSEKTVSRDDGHGPDHTGDKSQTDDDGNGATALTVATDRDSKENPIPKTKNSTRGRYQTQLTVAILTQQILALMQSKGHQENRDLFVDDPGSFVAFALAASADKQHGDGSSESPKRTRRAFFDVSGPCHVLTPFNTDMDILPRPATRAMSSSWVVQPENMQSHGGDRDGSSRTIPDRGRIDIVEAFRPVRPVKGMWAVGEQALTRYMMSCRSSSGKSNHS